MAGKKGANSKREAGLAKKAENAQKKAAVQAARDEAAESEKWSQGAKSNAKKEAAAAKKEDAARKKAERDAMLAEEEKNTPGRSNPKNSKQATKKTRGLDLSQLDNEGSLPALNASGIDNALDALSLTHKSGNDHKIDRHPERRFPAAYAAYEERRLEEMKANGSGDGLRLEQKKQKIRKEFEKHPDNPFNQLTAAYDATKEEINEIRQKHKKGIEQRLGS